MASGKHIFVFEQGASIERVITWTDSKGVAIDNTGYTAAMQVRKEHASAGTILSFSSPADITVGGTDGKFTLVVASAVMTAAPVGRFVYDFEITSPGGSVTRLLEGPLIITPEVTK